MFKTAASTMIATLAAANINEDFHGLLHGEEQLRGTHMEPMWEQFKEEYEALSPVDLDEDAMFTFFNNVDRVINHNSRSDKTFTQGINAFTAMTSEEFAEHFHLAEN